MKPATYSQVAHALAGLGNDRVLRTQKAAAQGAPDATSGSLLLALGCRETWLANIEGGAQLKGGIWVVETRQDYMDVGCFQISRRWHKAALAKMPGVKAGTWKPVVEGKTAANKGYCPRFADSLKYVVHEFTANEAEAKKAGIPKKDIGRVITAAHNCGIVNAIKGYREGNVDKYTTGGDYSAWVFATRTLINRWLGQHPNWKYVPA